MLTAAPPYLTDDEVDEMCAPLKQSAAQVRRMRGLGYTVHRKPNGRPLVWRLAEVSPPHTADPDDVDEPPRVPFAQSPLGRWQAARRLAVPDQRPDARQLTKAERQAIALAISEKRAALVRHHSAKRRAAKLCRTPPWADMEAIRAVYVEARALTVATGIEHHVDHEIPLQGRLVSGLHVPANLRILTGVENSRKRNKFEPC
jgi:hypothetical protein